MLIGFYQTIVTLLTATMVRATFVPGLDGPRSANLAVHAQLVAAIRDQDGPLLEKVLARHHEDTIRVL
jgi:DNA-binding GntR family transcriptional regulator